VVAHYGDGSIAMFPVMANGALGPCSNYLKNAGCSIDQGRQRSAHAHGCFFSPDDSLLVEPDLGADRIYMYRTGVPKFALIPESVPFAATALGSGPRHFVFHPNLPVGYAVNELANTITRYHCANEEVRLVPQETISTLDPQLSGASIAAEIAVDRAGRFLYCSNRGADDIAVFAIDHEGKLTLIQRIDCGGRTPRHFALDPTQKFVVLCNQDSDNVVVFARGSTTGKLQYTGIQIQVVSPTCVDFASYQVLESSHP
jgi:6-phosphogluconolactonase